MRYRGLLIAVFVVAIGSAIWLWRGVGAGSGDGTGRHGTVIAPQVEGLAEPRAIVFESPVEVLGRAEPGMPSSIVASEALPPTLVVHVVDEAGLPLAGALVTPFTPRPFTSVPTNQDGIAAIDVAGRSDVDLIVRHPYFRFSRTHAAVASEGVTDVTVMLRKGIAVCILLLADTGGPVGGATVRFRECEDPDLNHLGIMLGVGEELESYLMNDLFENQFQETRISEPDGRACISGITEGLINISVEAPGFVYVDQQVFDVGPNGGDLGVLSLTTGVPVTGTVADAAGPVAGAVVEGILRNKYLRVATDETGHFDLGHAEYGRGGMPFRVSHPSRGDFYNPTAVIDSGPITVQLVPSVPARLLLTDATTAEPIQGEYTRTVNVPQEPLLIMCGQPKTCTLTAGVTASERVPYYSLGLAVKVEGYGQAFLDLPTLAAADGAIVEVKLSTGGPLLVRVLDGRTGAPVADCRVFIRRDTLVNGEQHQVVSVTPCLFDQAAGGYLIEAAEFQARPGMSEYIASQADGYNISEYVLLSKDGAWAVGDGVELRMPPKAR